jgi:hypothetical protein
MSLSRWVSRGGGWASAPEKKAPDQKQKGCSQEGCYQLSAIFRLIPSCLLSEIHSRKGTYDAQEAGQHETKWALSAGRDEPG